MAESEFEEGFSKVEYGITHADLESLGERKVRENLNRGVYGLENDKVHIYVAAWLKDKEFLRHQSIEEESVANARKALNLAEEANSIARSQAAAAWRAARYAMYAAAVAAIAAITANKDAILSILFN
jgi:beta-galactosidase GanA